MVVRVASLIPAGSNVSAGGLPDASFCFYSCFGLFFLWDVNESPVFFIFFLNWRHRSASLNRADSSALCGGKDGDLNLTHGAHTLLEYLEKRPGIPGKKTWCSPLPRPGDVWKL